MVEIREYLTQDEKSPFGNWFHGLDSNVAVKVNVALTRMLKKAEECH